MFGWILYLRRYEGDMKAVIKGFEILDKNYMLIWDERRGEHMKINLK